MSGFRLAVSWLTVVPVGAAHADDAAAARAIRWAPLIGAALGALAAGLLIGLAAPGSPPLVAALLTVGALALVTRGMHLDGLADTADGLGCYGPPERALAVMRDGGVGAFAVVTLVVVLGSQSAALAALVATRPWPTVLITLVLAVGAGRCAFSWLCRRGVPAARPEGFGAMVAGSQPAWLAALWAVLLAAAAVTVAPGRPWQGPLGILLAAAVVVGLSAHTRRRLGGLTGDVLGAASELATTAVLVVAVLGG